MKKQSRKKEKTIGNQKKIIFKRPSIRPPTTQNDVYVSRKSSYKALKKRCIDKFIHNPHQKEWHIHGLGAAMNRAIELSLELKKLYFDLVEMHVETGSVTLMDDFMDLVVHHEHAEKNPDDSMDLDSGEDKLDLSDSPIQKQSSPQHKDTGYQNESINVRNNSSIHIHFKKKIK